jgi:glyoxylase-like metal-dependent hydrolase (beta-lactamase superfamily II)
MQIQHFFDKDTFTLTYVVFDEVTKVAIVIDPVLDYNPNSGKFDHKSADAVLAFIRSHQLDLKLILETHAHADHLSGALYLKEKFPGSNIAIGAGITVVQKTFKKIFNIKELETDGSQFDLLLKDNEEVIVGGLKFKVIYTPGHTPACACYLFGDALFTGDTLFMPDYGTGRCDFPKGDAEDLFHSVQKLYQLPDSTRVFVGHDYMPGGRELRFETSIGESKKANIRIKGDTTQESFVKARRERDDQLDAPRLLLPSIQINIAAGKLPEAEDNGVRYIKLPIIPKD